MTHILCLRKLYFLAFTWIFSEMTPITNYIGACEKPPLRHPLTKDKSPQPNDRTPVKEIHRCPNTKWAAVTQPRQQGTRIAIPTTSEMGHAPLHNGISQVKAALANKHRRRSRKVKLWIVVLHKRSLENTGFRMEIPIKACAASMGTTMTICQYQYWLIII